MNPRVRLSLDTSNMGVNNRYSFVETPMEMSPPNQVHSQPHPDPATQDTYSVHQSPHYDIEKAQFAAQGPDIQQHPALQAPFADRTPQQSATESLGQNIEPPGSPGPLPVKTDPYTQNHEHARQNLPIAPDANPLQSPTIPYFPPPVRAPTAPTAPTPAAIEFAPYHQPGQISHPNQQIKGGGWSHGLCDCSSFAGTCCLGLVCPCIVYGRTQHRLSLRSRTEDPTNMLGHETCNGSCTAMALLCGFQCKCKSQTRNAFDPAVNRC